MAVGLFISLFVIGGVGYFLFRNYYAQSVLLLGGIALLIAALLLKGEDVVFASLQSHNTHSVIFNVIALFKNIIASKLSGIGLLIMSIGGFVNYMKHIGASEALVNIAVKPLQWFRKFPYLTAAMVIPIGQLLFMATPSAAGLSLLLMVAVYPLLMQLGISKVSAVAVITACTIFDMGPASGNVHQAAALSGMNGMEYFVNYQLPLILPAVMVMIPLYLLVNRYYDKKEGLTHEVCCLQHEEKPSDKPSYYALLPVLPIVLLFCFSTLFGSHIQINAPIAMITSMLITMAVELFRTRNFRQVAHSAKSFWDGAADVFASVVTLIICAEFFAEGIKMLGFIDSLVYISQHLGLGFIGVAGVMTTMIFGSSVLLGSGNASFFAFGPLVPGIVEQLAHGGNAVLNTADMIVTMQLAASTGRALSPIAGLIIATCAIAKISPFSVVKRNVIPLVGTSIFIFILNMFLR
ncbi:MAG: C4-dicarboxylate transporter DcuC [Marinifilaceae bacterium]